MAWAPGGRVADFRMGIGVDAVGQAYGMGGTASPDFPVAGNPFQAQYGGNEDAFVAKIALPPAICITATPATLWLPDGTLVPVTFAGTIRAVGSGVAPDTATYAVPDDYGRVQPSGTLSVRSEGSYAFPMDLQASRNGNDRDGREYIITVWVKAKAGNTGSAATPVIVPYDQGG